MQSTTHTDRVAQLRAAQQQWSEKNLQQAPHRAIPCTTSSEIPIVPLATPLDWSDERYLSHLGFPGEAPYNPWCPVDDVSGTPVDDPHCG